MVHRRRLSRFFAPASLARQVLSQGQTLERWVNKAHQGTLAVESEPQTA